MPIKFDREVSTQLFRYIRNVDFTMNRTSMTLSLFCLFGLIWFVYLAGTLPVQVPSCSNDER